MLSSKKAASTVTFSYLELRYISHQVKGDRLKGTGFDPRQEKAPVTTQIYKAVVLRGPLAPPCPASRNDLLNFVWIFFLCV